VIEVGEVAQEGLTLIYGPPGAGKTSIAMRLADRLGNRVMWISTTEGPNFLALAAKRVGASPEKFAFLDFPRAFREDIAKYVLEHAHEYDVVVVDSVNGLASSVPSLEKLAHSVFYQISRDRPVILVAEEEPRNLHYIADHVVHVWYKINSVGHLIRYVQLEKSRKRPPGPRYIFDIVEGEGIVYIYFTSLHEEQEIVKDDKLGIELPKKCEICLGSTSSRKMRQVLSKIKDEAVFIQVGPWTSYRGVGVDKRQEIVLATFHDLFKLWKEFEYKRLADIRYLVVSGLLNLSENELHDYLHVLYAFLNYVDFLVFVNVGPLEEIKRLEKYCTESIWL